LQNNRRTKGAIYTHSTAGGAEGICSPYQSRRMLNPRPAKEILT